MPGWFASATQVFRRPAAPAVPFEVRCPCRAPVTGVRAKTALQVPCGVCGRLVFVLPESPYPPVAPRPATARKKKRTGGRRRGDEEIPISDAQPTPPTLATRTVSGIGGFVGGIVRGAGTAVRSFATPLRLVFLGVAVVLLATTGWIWHQQALRQAAAVFEAAAERGRAALQQGELVPAATEFKQAAAAAAVLGRDDPAAQRVHQQARETHAALNLLSDGLFSLIEEALAARASAAEEEWGEDFRLTFQDSWLILDTTAIQSMEAAGDPLRRIDLGLVVQGKPVQLVFDFSVFEKLLVDAQPRRVIFAARFHDCRPVAGDRWEIELAAEDAFLWTDPATLALCLPAAPDEATVKTLSDQARLLELPP